MSLLILSARPQLRTNARLVEAGRRIGVEVLLKDAVKLVASIDSPGASITECGEAVVPDPAGWSVLARVGNWRPESMLGLLESCCAVGMSTLNPPDSIRCARDHWRTLELLARQQLPIPHTLAGLDPEELAVRAGQELGFPLIIKLRRSRMGVGVMRAESRDQLESLLDSLWRLGEEFILQEFIPCSGRSTRVFLLRGEIIAAAQFSADAGEWRSNGARGGKAMARSLSGDEQSLAVRAAESLTLGLVGVDLLEGKDGPLICEVNPTPGFLHLEEATGINIASAIVESALS